jgi:hypothetical protein
LPFDGPPCLPVEAEHERAHRTVLRRARTHRPHVARVHGGDARQLAVVAHVRDLVPRRAVEPVDRRAHGPDVVRRDGLQVDDVTGQVALGPLPAAPVEPDDQRTVVEVPDGPHLVGRDRLDVQERALATAGRAARIDVRPQDPVPVQQERGLERSARIAVVPDDPDVVLGDRGHAREDPVDLARQLDLGPRGAVVVQDERDVAEPARGATGRPHVVRAGRVDREQLVHLGAGVRHLLGRPGAPVPPLHQGRRGCAGIARAADRPGLAGRDRLHVEQRVRQVAGVGGLHDLPGRCARGFGRRRARRGRRFEHLEAFARDRGDDAGAHDERERERDRAVGEGASLRRTDVHRRAVLGRAGAHACDR